MKRTGKIAGIVAAILIIISVIMMIVGLLMGGIDDVVSDILDGRLSIGYNSFINDEVFEDMTSIEENNSIDGTEVTSVEFDADYGEFEIVAWDSSDYKIDNLGKSDDNKIRYSIDNGVLKIAIRGNNMFSFGNNEVKVAVYVPNDAVISEFKINLGAGEIVCKDLDEIVDFDVNIGAGRGDFLNIVAHKLIIDVGAGEGNVKKSVFEEAELRVGVGELNIDATIEGNIDADCGVGEMDVDLAGAYTDYNYKVDVGIGEVTIGNENYSNDDNTIIIDDDNSTINVKCGVGEVSVEFGEQGAF